MRLLLPLLLFCVSVFCNAQANEKISDCFTNGDANQLASHFNSSIELNIPNNSGIYQKKQAQLLLQDFFTDNPTTSYEIKHEGGSKQRSRFHIGKLSTEKGPYRTYLLYNSEEGMIQIIELRIEEE